MFDWKPVHRANAGAGVDWLRKLITHLLVIVRQSGSSKPKNRQSGHGQPAHEYKTIHIIISRYVDFLIAHSEYFRYS
jgi:hypothetical protein